MNGFKEVCFKQFIEKLDKDIKNYESRIKAWQNVKRVYKKDGTDYRNITQNFEGCYFQKGILDELECCVDYTTYNGGESTEIIALHQLVCNLPFEVKENQEILGGVGWLPYIIVDAEQLEILINNLIKELQGYLVDVQEQYDKGVKLFPQFWNKLDELAKFVYENTENKSQMSLDYAFLDIIKKQFNLI